MKQIEVELTDEQFARLQSLAAEQHRWFDELMSWAIDQYLAKLESERNAKPESD